MIVRDVITKVSHWTLVDGGQPDRPRPDVDQVVQPRGDPGQVSGPVIIGVLEGSGIDLVDDGVLPPLFNDNNSHNFAFKIDLRTFSS